MLPLSPVALFALMGCDITITDPVVQAQIEALEQQISDLEDQVGGAVFGYGNQIAGDWAFTNGALNVARGEAAAALGGAYNTASGDYSAAGGGFRDVASGEFAAATAGAGGLASGAYSAVAGGSDNTASGAYAAEATRTTPAAHTA